MVVALAGLVLIASGCSCGSSTSGDAIRSTTSVPSWRMCDLIYVPRTQMRKDRTTFAEVVEDRTGRGADRGISAGIAFAIMFRSRSHAGRFERVLGYLADRAVAETGSGSGASPPLTKAIVENARELDRFLADGGCG